MKYRCFLCASSGHREPLWKVPQSTLPGNPPCGSVTLQGVHGLENMGKMEGTTDVQWFSHISPITFGSLSFVRVSAFFLWRDHRFSINTPPLIDSPTSFPMIFPWFSHDFPMIFPWFPHDFPMICQDLRVESTVVKGRAANLLMRGETWSTFLATDWENGDFWRGKMGVQWDFMGYTQEKCSYPPVN